MWERPWGTYGLDIHAPSSSSFFDNNGPKNVIWAISIHGVLHDWMPIIVVWTKYRFYDFRTDGRDFCDNTMHTNTLAEKCGDETTGGDEIRAKFAFQANLNLRKVTRIHCLWVVRSLSIKNGFTDSLLQWWQVFRGLLQQTSHDVGFITPYIKLNKYVISSRYKSKT